MNNWITTLRPKYLSEVIGQDKIIKSIAKHLKEETLGQNILLSGVTGTGKTTIARLIAKTINCIDVIVDKVEDIEYFAGCNNCDSCNSVDYSESSLIFHYFSGADTNIETIRNIKNICEAPNLFKEKKRIIYLDEIQNISSGKKSSMEELLPLLEKDYKGEVYFIFSTMKVNKIDKSILDRIHNHWRLQSIKSSILIEHAGYLFDKLNIKQDIDYPISFTKVLLLIAENAEGSARQFIKNLETCIHDEIFTVEEAIKYLGLSDIRQAAYLVKVLLDKDKKLFIKNLYEMDSIEDFFYYSYAILSDLIVYKTTGITRFVWQKTSFDYMKNKETLKDVMNIYNNVASKSNFDVSLYKSKLGEFFSDSEDITNKPKIRQRKKVV